MPFLEQVPGKSKDLSIGSENLLTQFEFVLLSLVMPIIIGTADMVLEAVTEAVCTVRTQNDDDDSDDDSDVCVYIYIHMYIYICVYVYRCLFTHLYYI